MNSRDFVKLLMFLCLTLCGCVNTKVGFANRNNNELAKVQLWFCGHWSNSVYEIVFSGDSRNRVEVFKYNGASGPKDAKENVKVKLADFCIGQIELERLDRDLEVYRKRKYSNKEVNQFVSIGIKLEREGNWLTGEHFYISRPYNTEDGELMFEKLVRTVEK